MKELLVDNAYSHKCQDLIVDKPPSAIDELMDAHCYICGSQYTIEACRKILVDRKVLTKEQKQDSSERKVVKV